MSDDKCFDCGRRDGGHYGFCTVGPYEYGFREGLLEAARIAEENGENYPTDVWPETSQHPEARVAAGCRLASRNIAAAIRARAAEGER